MANFDAGTIEATLTLDRSPFTQGLRIAQQQAAAFERDAIEPRLDIDTAGAMAELAALKALANTLDGQRIAFDVDIDSSGAMAEMAAIRAMMDLAGKRVSIGVDLDTSGLADDLAGLAALQALDGRDIDLRVDVRGAAMAIQELLLLKQVVDDLDGRKINIAVDLDKRLAGLGLTDLTRQINRLDGREIDIDVDADRTGGLTRSNRGVSTLLMAILSLAPLAVPVVAGLTAGVAALGGALAGAGGGAVILGVGLIGPIKAMGEAGKEITQLKDKLETLEKGSAEYIETAKQLKEAQAAFNEEFGPAAAGLEAMKDAWKEFQDATREPALELIADGLNLVASVLPKITPLFELFAEVAGNALGKIQEFVDGDEMDRLVEFFGTHGVVALEQFLRIGGNLILFFGRIFEAFGPFTDLFITGLADMTARWAEWADGIGKSQGFQDFIAYVVETGPLVLEMFRSLFDALVNIGVGLAPLAGPMLEGLIGFFRLIADMDPNTITNIALGVGAIAAAVKAWGVAQGILNLLMAMNPMGLVIVAVAALAAGLVIAYRESETFRQVVQDVFAAVQDAAGVLMAFWSEELWPLISQVWEDIKAAFTDGKDGTSTTLTELQQALQEIWDFLVLWGEAFMMVVRTVVDVVTTLWGVFGSTLLENTRDSFNNVLQFIQGAFQILQGFFNVFIGLFTGDWSRMWEGIKGIASGAWTAITAIFQQAWNVISGAAQMAWAAFSAMFDQGVQNGVRIVATLPGKVAGALRTLGQTVEGVARAAWALFATTIGAKTIEILTDIGQFAGKVKSKLGDLGGLLVSAGRDLIEGLASGIRAAVSDTLEPVLNWVTDKIPDWKGPADRDATLLRPAGRLIIGGLTGGLEDEIPALERTLAGITSMISGVAAGPGMSGVDPGASPVIPGAVPGMDAAMLAELIEETRRTRQAMEDLAEAYEDADRNDLLLKRTGAK